MDSFKKNITNIKKEDRDKYFRFQLPQDLQKDVGDKVKGIDTSMKGVKKRLEEQLETRKTYVSLLEEYLICMKDYEKNPVPILKSALEVAKTKVDIHNTKIEIVAQKNVFVDTYMYYKEDFLKRYEEDKGKKSSVFSKK
jgi:hypothetical protein|tara:strand:- start:366 stop:782 length:417 start_codon:yes stop_codon:yes gene_type:complete